MEALLMRSWFVVAALLLGCSKKTEEKPAPSSQLEVKTTADAAAAASSGSGDCAKRAERLEQELRELATTKPGFVPIVQGITAPSASGAQPIKERGWVIAVARDGSMFIQGHRFEKTEHASVVEHARTYTDAMFKTALEKFIMDGGSSRDLSVPLYIWADRDAPASVLAELVTYADPEGPWPPRPGGKRKPSASADDPPPPMEENVKEARKQAIEQARKAGIVGDSSEPRPSRVPMRLLVTAEGAAQPQPLAAAKLPPNEPESTSQVVQQLKAAIGTCPAIITTMGTASLEGTPAKEADKLAKDIPAGLVSCECKLADVDAFEAGMRTWFGAWAPPLSWVAMPKLDPKDTRTIGKVLAP
jgi:hypothetical protein